MKKTLLLLIFALIGITTIHTATAQTYDPYAVQVINTLIAKNQLQATPNAPETWEFATWNDGTPKQIIKLDLEVKNLTGNASFAGLITLQSLKCNENYLSKLNVTNCSELQELICWSNNLTELNLLNCTQLKILYCGLNKLTELNVSSSTLLKNLWFHYNEISEIDVSHCKQLESLGCHENRLSKLDLTGLNKLNDFYGADQKTFIKFYKNGAGEYTCNISLNNPIFGHSALSYSDGILKSSNVGVKSTSFEVKTNKAGCKLTGTMFLDYDGVGLETYNSYELQVINNLIANNGLNATPNAPETWEFATWNYELPKQITTLNFYRTYYPIPLTGDVSFANFTALENFNCNWNSLTKLDLSNCTVLQNLSCQGNTITELDVTNCKKLKYLSCAHNNLTKLIVTNCTELQDMFCYNNNLTELNLTGLNNLKNFYGSDQKRFLTLYKNNAEEYTCNISLNNPTLGNSAISYFGGILKSTKIAATKSSFKVHTNKEGFNLSGTLLLEYDGIGLGVYNPYELQVINNLIANNGLQATPNKPLEWDFATWNEELPKQITELFFPTAYSGWPYSLSGDVSLAGLTALNKLECFVYPKKEQTTINRYAITKLNVANCTSLHFLDCFLNFDLNEIDLTNCNQLQSLGVNYCGLTNIDLSDCKQLTSFVGDNQRVSLTLAKNKVGEYIHPIFLNNPTFENTTISYFGGILKSADSTVFSTTFTVQTYKQGFELSGTMNFTYSDVGMDTLEYVFKVYPNPTTGELRIENYELQITNVEVYDTYGRKILSHTANRTLQTSINISHLHSGIYFIRIITKTDEIIKKVVKL